jgi:hypothetical protein
MSIYFIPVGRAASDPKQANPIGFWVVFCGYVFSNACGRFSGDHLLLLPATFSLSLTEQSRTAFNGIKGADGNGLVGGTPTRATGTVALPPSRIGAGELAGFGERG